MRTSGQALIVTAANSLCHVPLAHLILPRAKQASLLPSLYRWGSYSTEQLSILSRVIQLVESQSQNLNPGASRVSTLNPVAVALGCKCHLDRTSACRAPCCTPTLEVCLPRKRYSINTGRADERIPDLELVSGDCLMDMCSSSICCTARLREEELL